MAQKMRGQGPAQGREVGPLGVYMAPNWAEALSGAVTPAIGGYMEGQANRKDEDLDAERTMQKVALYKAAQAEKDKEKAERESRYAVEDAQAAAILNEDIAARESTEAYRAASLKAANTPKDEWTDKTYWKAPLPEGEVRPEGESDKITFKQHLNGTYKTTGGRLLDSEQAEQIGQLTPYTTGNSASVKPTAKQRDAEVDTQAFNKNLATLREGIDSLEKTGGDASGWKGLLVTGTPELLQGAMEAAIFEEDEIAQRAAMTYFDAAMLEAVSTGVLSDSDVKRLGGITISKGGMKPQQIRARMRAAEAMVNKKGLSLYGTFEEAEAVADPEEDELMKKYM